MKAVQIIGAGLAGCEAAWQVARQGVPVTLHEMKPHQHSPAHHLPGFAELVCSNSLRGESLENAVGLLKEEMRRMGSLFMTAADACRVPAGGALAVDREEFSRFITERIAAHPLIEVVHGEVTAIPGEGIVVIASGPLTSDLLARQVGELTGEYLYFYDAIAPIVAADSIDQERIFRASRYGKGDGDDYLNCPLNQEEYVDFVTALCAAEKVPPRSFEKLIHFEGCMPVEVLAARGVDTLRFGPMKPVGLVDPRTGVEPYAVVQLRQENLAATMYNLVGFQTKLTYPEQQRVFRMIPALGGAEFVRLGSMHRNTYINAPTLLQRSFQMRQHPRIFFAGQITGVEGYVESAASGLLAGINAGRLADGLELLDPPPETALGSLAGHITGTSGDNFQPMNINYGLFPELGGRVKKKEKRSLLARRALDTLDAWLACRLPGAAGFKREVL